MDAREAGAERGAVERAGGDAGLERLARDLRVGDERRAGGGAEADAPIREPSDPDDPIVRDRLTDATRAVERAGVRRGLDALRDRPPSHRAAGGLRPCSHPGSIPAAPRLASRISPP